MTHMAPPQQTSWEGSQTGSGVMDTTFPSISKSSNPGRSVTERLWHDFFMDPSQWRDKRKSKANPKAPDFKHKITKKSLWIDSWDNPGWVKDMLEKKECRSKVGQARSNSEECGFVKSSIICQASVISGVQMNASHNEDYIDLALLSLEEALTCLERMPQLPSIDNFIYTFQKCREKKSLAYTKRLHTYLCERGLEAHRSLGNYVVPLLVECGSMCEALQVFNRLVDPNEYSWTSIITGYIGCGESQHALSLYQKMQEDCVHPSKYTFVALVKACARLNNVERGREIHAEISKKGLEGDFFVGNTLVDMYAKCGSLVKAQEVFDKLPFQDLVSWNALIAGYALHGLCEKALNCFEQMQVEGVAPDALTYVCSLKACASIQAIHKGQEIHAEISIKGLERDSFLSSTLVDMYAKCGLLAEARDVFGKLLCRDAISWTTLIAGYAEHGLGEEALNCFERMQLEGVSPDDVTFVCSLKACGSVGAMDKGHKIHRQIARKGLERDLCIGNTLVDMYAKCGSLAEALEVFDKLPVRNVVSWNALISGYVDQGLGEEALDCFEQMQLEGGSPNAITFVCSLKACGSVRAMAKGCEIHAKIVIEGLERDPCVGNALVDMYAKCGWLARAREEFDELQVQDVVSWTSLIAGYAQHGLVEEALNCFQQMQLEGVSPNVVSWTALIAGYAQLGESEVVFRTLERMREEGIQPDGVTFVSVLAVCTHVGLVDEGQRYFEAMMKDYGITPTIEHYTCIIDLFGRAGLLDEAVVMLEKMPFPSNLAVWLTVLGFCQKWGNVELGRQAFEHAVQLDEKDATAYVLMSNIYTGAHMLEDVKKVEARRVKEQAWQKPGESWTEVDGIMHTFVVGDTGHSQIKDIHAKLKDLYLKMQQEGYTSGLHCASMNTSSNPKKDGLCGHSERLAIVCALLNTPKGTPLRIVKNLRVCDDCHSVSKLISKIEQRTILARDANRVHVFKEGKCICGDHW